MDCATATREALAEKYLRGELSENEREAFELHFFACQRCLDELRTVEALRTDLQANRSTILAKSVPLGRSWRWGWAVAVAVVLISAGSVLWLRTPATQAPAPSQTSVLPQPESAKRSPPVQTMQSAPAGHSLAELARFDPPTYTPAVLRGVQDEAMRKFRASMKHYQQGHYDLAITGLREAAKLNPEDAGALFFLGISYLLSGRTDDGVAALQQCVALGDTPYLEEAHYYLAKAFLKKNDSTAAEAELQKVVHLRGALLSKARALLQEIQALQGRLDQPR